MIQSDIDQAVSEAEERLKSYFLNVLNQVHSVQDEITKKLEERLEQFEQQLALITQAYAELAAILEALYASIVGKGEEEQEEFKKNLQVAHNKMVDALSNAVHDAERDADRFVAYPSDPAEGSTSNESNK